MERSKGKSPSRTSDVWQPRADHRLSVEDAREITENVTGFFELLLKWEAMEREDDSCKTDVSCYAISA